MLDYKEQISLHRVCGFCLLLCVSIVSLMVYGRRTVGTFIDSIRIVQPHRGILVTCNAPNRMLL